MDRYFAGLGLFSEEIILTILILIILTFAVKVTLHVTLGSS
jgi:hypothetical protein